MSGLSFGFNKGKTSEQKTSLSKEDLNQIQLGQTEQTTAGTQDTTGTQSQTSQGTSDTSTTGATTSTGATSTSTDSKSQVYSNDILDKISQFASKMLGGGGAGDAAVGAGLDYMGNFDPKAFVAKTMAAAQGSSDFGLKQLVQGLVDRGGKGNSMTQIAANKASFDAANALAGTQAATEAAAQGIVGQNTQIAQGVNNSYTQGLSQILDALKGGVQLNTGAQTTDTTQAQQSQQQAGTTTTEASQAQSQQQQTTMQQISEMVQQLLDSTKITDVAETLKGKTSSIGGGLSLSGGK